MLAILVNFPPLKDRIIQTANKGYLHEWNEDWKTGIVREYCEDLEKFKDNNLYQWKF